MTITISDLEMHFVQRADEGASIDSILLEFAKMVRAKFIKFKYRNPDSYGVLVDDEVWINIFYSRERRVFGFQAFLIDGTLQAVLPLQNSDASIVDLVLRVSSNIGNFSTNDDSDDDSSDSF